MRPQCDRRQNEAETCSTLWRQGSGASISEGFNRHRYLPDLRWERIFPADTICPLKQSNLISRLGSRVLESEPVSLDSVLVAGPGLHYIATHVAKIGDHDAAAAQPTLTLWIPSRPVMAKPGSLHLTSGVMSRMERVDDGRNELRVSASAVFDQFTELGALAHNLFDDSWGRSGVAQLKILSPDPGIRLIGGFVEPEIYVGLRIYWRDELDFKATGQKGLIGYEALGREAAAEWDALLPSVSRMPMKDFYK